MADDSNRIGTSRVSTGLGQVRKISGVAGAASGGSGAFSIDGGGAEPTTTPRGSFGPRGSRMLPADYPEDQLDRRAARGTYLDILV